MDDSTNGNYVENEFDEYLKDTTEDLSLENPLMNVLVLTKLFEFITNKPSCRLVCQKWNILILPYIRKRTIVKFVPRCSSDIQFIVDTQPKILHKFTRLFAICEECPFNSFEIRNISMKDYIVQNFFCSCAPFLKELFLTFYHKNFNINLLHLLNMLQDLPSLENLSIDYLPKKIHSSVRDLWPLQVSEPTTHIRANGEVKIFPKLRSLRFPFNHYPGNESLQLLCAMVRGAPNIVELQINHKGQTQSTLTTLKESVHRKLIKLQIFAINERQVQLLQQMSQRGLQLQVLIIINLSEDVRTASLERFFRSQAASLKMLIVERFPLHPSLTDTFKMPCMKVLSTLISDKRTPIEIFASLSTNNFPNLKILELYSVCKLTNLFEDSFSVLAVRPIVSVRQLKIEIDVLDTCGVTYMQGLARLFCCVKKLTLFSPTEQMVVNLWKYWPSVLEELHILNLQSTTGLFSPTSEIYMLDSVLTGIPSVVCSYYLSKGNFLDLEAEGVEALRQQPSICRMTGLRKFFLSFRYRRTGIAISDVTGYFALAFLDRLEEFEFTRCGLSKTCKEYLKTKLKFLVKIPTGRMNDSVTLKSALHNSTIPQVY